MPRFRVRVLRFRVRVLRFRVRVLRFRVRVLRFRVRVLRFRVRVLRFRVFGCFVLRSSFSSAECLSDALCSKRGIPEDDSEKSKRIHLLQWLTGRINCYGVILN